jgi:uncharacterized protein YbjT (DUF2867 family)
MAAGWKVRGLTHHLNRPEAEIMAKAGVEMVEGDLDDPQAVKAAMDGAYGVFMVLSFREEGVEAEVRQGRTVADAALEAGVEHFVYSSVGGAERKTGIPHFDSKWKNEEYIRSLGLAWTFVRPVWFMENFNHPAFREAILSGTLTAPIKPNRPLQMIAVDDIGAFAAIAFGQREKMKNRALEIAGDELTFPQAAEAFSRAIGRSVDFNYIPVEKVAEGDKEGARMFNWFNRSGYNADIPPLRSMHPGLLTFEQWLRNSDWLRSGKKEGGTLRVPA